MPRSRSRLLPTWLYRAIGVTPRCAARRRMLKVSTPSWSSRASASANTRSRVNVSRLITDRRLRAVVRIVTEFGDELSPIYDVHIRYTFDFRLEATLED